MYPLRLAQQADSEQRQQHSFTFVFSRLTNDREADIHYPLRARPTPERSVLLNASFCSPASDQLCLLVAWCCAGSSRWGFEIVCLPRKQWQRRKTVTLMAVKVEDSERKETRIAESSLNEVVFCCFGIEMLLLLYIGSSVLSKFSVLGKQIYR